MVLWCLFSERRHAWEDETGHIAGVASLGFRVMAGDRPDLTAIRPGTPTELRALIERCWAHDSAARPTAAAIARETDTWQRVRRGNSHAQVYD